MPVTDPWRETPDQNYARDTDDYVYVSRVKQRTTHSFTGWECIGWKAHLIAADGRDEHLGPFPSPERAMHAADTAWPWSSQLNLWEPPQTEPAPTVAYF